jgi:hypothetical protein
MVAGEEVRFAVIRDGYFDQVSSGENMEEGVLGEITRTFEEGQRFFAVISGVANPEGYPPNPDGRSTDLQLFVKQNYQPAAETREQVRLFAGHFVPDGSLMELAFEGTGETLSNLQYGDMGAGIALAPDVYEMTMVMHGEAPGKTDGVAVEKTVELDLREREGETIALFASGFVNPAENNDGPALNLKTHSADGETTTPGEESTGTDVEEVADARPEKFHLGPNYPNPFNPSTVFEYAVPEQSYVQVTVYDAMGKEVARLVDGRQSAGQYTAQFDASDLSSGLYIYRLDTPEYRETRTMMLVK